MGNYPNLLKNDLVVYQFVQVTGVSSPFNQTPSSSISFTPINVCDIPGTPFTSSLLIKSLVSWSGIVAYTWDYFQIKLYT